MKKDSFLFFICFIYLFIYLCVCVSWKTLSQSWFPLLKIYELLMKKESFFIYLLFLCSENVETLSSFWAFLAF